ncbi:hypothetical protein ALC57_14203 [Trachymyrmex cornetzi]|uniref:Uncharacterized protein n=1 Tax=Trachymyrmex cornetzi TaxID=471704 RepID=A0A151IYK8_9HYME|nr:hypothetical protein ALC57_14203 [Trachymyrmex cornetzi]
MDIVIDIQGFRDVEDNFIPKEVAVLAINATITWHWIMRPPFPFGKLPERARRENNWLTRNYHGIEWFDGDVNPVYFTIHLRAITRHARYIYTRGQEKSRYLSNLHSRNVYNLEGISPAFKNLPDFGGCGQRSTHHGFRTNVGSHCALRNAYKLKRWLAIRNSSNSSYDSLPSENCSESDVESEKTNSENFSIKFKNQKNDIFRNIEAKYIVEKKYRDRKGEPNEDEQATVEENKDLPKFDSTADKANTSVSQTTSIFENSTTHVLAKVCPTCGGLSCRPTAEDVDEVDCHCR